MASRSSINLALFTVFVLAFVASSLMVEAEYAMEEGIAETIELVSTKLLPQANKCSQISCHRHSDCTKKGCAGCRGGYCIK